MPILTDRVGGSPTRGAGRPPPLGHGLSEEDAGVRGQRLSVTMSLVSADVSRACLVMEGPAHGLASAVGGKGFRTSEGGERALDKAAPGRVVCVCVGGLWGREGRGCLLQEPVFSSHSCRAPGGGRRSPGGWGWAEVRAAAGGGKALSHSLAAHRPDVESIWSGPAGGGLGVSRGGPNAGRPAGKGRGGSSPSWARLALDTISVRSEGIALPPAVLVKVPLLFSFCFLGLHLRHMEVPRPGVEWGCSCPPTPQPQQYQIQSVSSTRAHGNTGSLTH